MTDQPDAPRYTLSDLQKALSDDRAARGRTEKDIAQRLQTEVTAKYETELAELTAQASHLSDENQTLRASLSAYEATLAEQTARLTTTLRTSANLDDDTLSRITTPLQALSPIDAYQSLSAYADVLTHTASTHLLNGPIRTPQRAAQAMKQHSALDQLAAAVSPRGPEIAQK